MAQLSAARVQLNQIRSSCPVHDKVQTMKSAEMELAREQPCSLLYFIVVHQAYDRGSARGSLRRQHFHRDHAQQLTLSAGKHSIRRPARDVLLNSYARGLPLAPRPQGQRVMI